MVAFSFLACFLTRQSPLPLYSRLTATALEEDLRDTIREGIAQTEAFDLKDWEESVTIVVGLLSCKPDEAERVLADATRWLSWARAGELARKYIKPDVVNPAQLEQSLKWLRSGPLALSEEQIVDAVQNYPQLYLLEPAEKYRKVLGVAPRQYRDADVLRTMLLDDPSILQFQYNCDNDCISECGSCWVTLQNRL